MADLRGDGQRGIGFATLDFAEVFPTDATLTSEAVVVSAASLARSRHAAHGAAVLALLVGGGVSNVLAHSLR